MKLIDFIGFAVIGVLSTSARVTTAESPLITTINSLLESSSVEDKRNMTIIIFIGSHSKTNDKHKIHYIQSRYMDYIQSGFIQIVELDRWLIYPNIVDSWIGTGRVLAAMYYYVHISNMGQVYVQLKEGMIARNGFLSDVEYFIRLRRRSVMVVGNFANDKLFGTVFKIQDLKSLSLYITMFPSNVPIDKVIDVFKRIKSQYKPHIYYKDIFYVNSLV